MLRTPPPRQDALGPAGLRAASLALFLGLAACGAGDEAEIPEVRPASPDAAFAKADASSAERFGHEDTTHGGGAGGGQRFAWEMPEGWVELPRAQFREVNLRPAADPELECYLTILQGDGGGLLANVNRWRDQMDLAPITEEAALELPEGTLFGRPAVRVDLTTEGDAPRSLLGMILMTTGSLATVKMTGPADRVDAERDGFERFCSTLGIREELAAAADAADAGGAPAVEEAPAASGMSGVPGRLSYDLPEGWTDVGASSMRIVDLRAPGESQCYVIRLPGEAGGLLGNLNRWRSEVGLEPFDAAAVDELDTVELLGEECKLLEVSGEYRGMSSQSGPGMTLLGVALIGTESSLFVKMVGPEADVAAERGRFLELLASLDES